MSWKPASPRDLRAEGALLSRLRSVPTSTLIPGSFHIKYPPVTYNTFTPKEQIMASQVEKRQGILGRSFAIPTLLFFSFWMFGTLVTMQFGVVLTAANDLVGNSAPPGLILFAYTLPSVLVRAFVPYMKFPNVSAIFSPFSAPKPRTPSSATPEISGHGLKNSEVSREINYAARLTVCATSSFVGLQLLAWADNVGVRMFGIALASLSSNLGDMSFYQLATRYPAMISRSLGGYAAGSGAAGLLGSFIYTLLTSSFGATPSAVLSGIGVVPTIMLLTYSLVLPSPNAAREAALANSKDTDDIPMEEEEEVGGGDKGEIIGGLKLGDKIRMVRPMAIGYMTPLAILMFLENVTTQGILPTILFHLPFSGNFTSYANTLMIMFRSLRDFYPVFFTVYQSAVFFGRTSITLFRLPGGNKGSSSAYWALCLVEVGLFLSLLNQSWSMGRPRFADMADINLDANVLFHPFIVIILIFTMGLCGGLGMSNTYWRVSKKPLPRSVWQAFDKASSKRLHQKGRTISAQEDRILTPSDSEDESSYFAPRPRLRKLVSLRTYLDGSQEALLQDRDDPPKTGSASPREPSGVEMRSQEEEMAVREFLISTIALPDTFAIMMASIVSMWLQPELCRWQVSGGRNLCKE